MRRLVEHPALVVTIALVCAVGMIIAGQFLRTTDTPTTISARTVTTPPPSADSPPTLDDGAEPGSDSADEPAELDERLYGIGELAGTDCADAAVDGTSTEQLAAFAEQAVDDCLMPAWSPALERVGVSLQRPRTEIVSSDSVSTECGELSNDNAVVAVYCPRSEVIYLFSSGMTTYADRAGWLPLTVIAHEFGHHVQNATDSWPVNDDDTSDRRIELQAECLAGAWFHSGQETVDDFSLELVLGRYVSNDSHGSVEVRQDWFRRGYSSGDSDDCRTYTAEVDEVS